MELKEFNAQHNHKCSEERRYKYPREAEVLASLEKFKDKKFGLMIHWGLYSKFNSYESWLLPDQDRSWAWAKMDKYKDMSGKDFRAMYHDLINEFNPTAFAPEKWAETAKNVGFKYLVFTTKHHDGFCLWDTQYSDWKVTADCCPYHVNKNADICKSVFDAFRKQGINVHAYFSKPDWNSEYYWKKSNSKKDYKTRMTNYNVFFNRKLWKKFVEYTENQMLELIKNYGAIDCLWLDGGQVNPARGMGLNLSEIARKAREIQPGLMIADRTIGGINENFLTPEQAVPDHVINAPWESCITMGSAFSFHENDTYKDARTLVHMLCNIVAKGGNLALNVAPDFNGNIPKEVYEILNEIGEWIKQNGFAIFSTRPTAPYADKKIAYTAKGDEVYAIYLAENGEVAPSKVELKYLSKAKEVVLKGVPQKFTQEGNILSVEVAGVKVKENELAYVFTIRK